MHGHFSLLSGLLDEVSFDSKVDRLFSLGDLIDRGDESSDVLQWLAKSWFFPIQGNHERMLINAINLDEQYMFHQWYMWGGDWAEDLSVEELEPFYSAFMQIPIAIELETIFGGSVALIHAELPDVCDWLEVKKLLERTSRNDIEKEQMLSDMLWMKSQPNASLSDRAKIRAVKNIDHVFHGHTPVDEMIRIQNRTFMDLGSYKSGKIGFIDLNSYLSSFNCEASLKY